MYDDTAVYCQLVYTDVLTRFCDTQIIMVRMPLRIVSITLYYNCVESKMCIYSCAAVHTHTRHIVRSVEMRRIGRMIQSFLLDVIFNEWAG